MVARQVRVQSIDVQHLQDGRDYVGQHLLGTDMVEVTHHRFVQEVPLPLVSEEDLGKFFFNFFKCGHY